MFTSVLVGAQPRKGKTFTARALLLYAAAGQPVIVTPFLLMGAMSPVSIPSALVQQTAEALGVITLVQMIRPGCPSVLGGFTSNVDMRTGSPACSASITRRSHASSAIAARSPPRASRTTRACRRSACSRSA